MWFVGEQLNIKGKQTKGLEMSFGMLCCVMIKHMWQRNGMKSCVGKFYCTH